MESEHHSSLKVPLPRIYSYKYTTLKEKVSYVTLIPILIENVSSHINIKIHALILQKQHFISKKQEAKSNNNELQKLFIVVHYGQYISLNS
jgi:hypothetical protein